MAKPIQYVQQYVPTDMNLAQNVLGMARQDMKERNQAFDQAAAFSNSSIGEMYGVESWDTEYRNQVVGDIQSKIDDTLKKRGGDYATAGNDIARLIMKERGNPFWNDNAKQMEAILKGKLAQAEAGQKMQIQAEQSKLQMITQAASHGQQMQHQAEAAKIQQHILSAI